MINFFNDFRFKSIFVKIFIYIMLSSLLVIFTLGAIFYEHITGVVADNVIDVNMSNIRNTQKSDEQLFGYLFQMIMDLSYDEDFINAMVIPGFNNPSRNDDIIRKLKNLASNYEYVDSVEFYVNYANMSYSSNGNISIVQVDEDIVSSKDKDNIILTPRNIEDRKCLTLCFSAPHNSLSTMGYFILNLSVDELYSKITENFSDNNHYFFVLDKNGYKVMGVENDEKYPKIIEKVIENNKSEDYLTIDDKIVFYSTMNSTNMKYLYILPLEMVLDDKSVINFVFMTILICGFASLLLTYLATRQIYMPINSLLNIVYDKVKKDKKQQAKNEYEYLDVAYSEIISANENLENVINNTKPFVKERLFSNLIRGKNIPTKELIEKMEFLNLNMNLSNYLVMVIQLQDYDKLVEQLNESERNLIKVELVSRIEEIVTKGICLETDVNKFAVIINFDEEESYLEIRKKSLDLAELIHQDIKKKYKLDVYIGVGRMYKHINSVKYSYKEANKALEYKLYLGQNRIFDFESAEEQTDKIYYFYSEKEKKLINVLKFAQDEKLERAVADYFNEIKQNGMISYDLLQKLLNKTVSSIIEMMLNQGISPKKIFVNKKRIYFTLTHNESIEEIVYQFEDICRLVIDAVSEKNSRNKQKYYMEIKEYIEKNYSEDISLNKISSHIGLTPSYFSTFFKEQFNKSFVDYLNRIRIDKAKEMLVTTQLSITEIGFKVGFNTIQNFMRVFKKYESISPGKYRELSED
ncbi:helix-turn-helix domain-containing protein [Vallitalea guaymasensis]|uniref:helix-turn-helix domain-containing protein n=1 Tax=Vallitalea guaymasensis TaxID=1185412 RepID=UPI00272CB777|nr:helix-turn-helix domain-containing protein [Vallitalea guaymasensis]